MTPDETRTRHDRVQALFLAALGLSKGERGAFLAGACEGDRELLEEVLSLLGQDDTGLLQRAGEAIVREARDLGPGAEDLPESIGGYRILGRIGAGGMGIVYEAEQASPSRRVALKVIRPGFVNDGTLRRFRYEAQVLGWLEHPGIARVYEAGTEDGPDGPQPWFAMELVEGQTLNRWVSERDLNTEARLALVAHICDAVHHAHQKGVIHRDLKPANVLVDVHGQPKVLDFGVARVTEHDLGTSTLQTLEGELIGTLPYMSPEQVEADPSKLDVRSDVYALGVIAYELLAGRLPHDLRDKRIAAAARAIVEEEPSTLGSLDTRLRGDVETIVAKAIDKDITRRYASAEELARDIRRHLGHEPIQARPPSAMYQLGKFARRNRGFVGGIVAAFVVLVLGIAVSWKLLLDTRAALGVAEQATEAATVARDDEKRQRKIAEANLERAEDAEVLARANAETARGEALAAEEVNDFLIELFFQADPGRAQEDLSVRDLLDRAALSIETTFADRPRQRADLAGVLGVVYESLGLPNRAEPLFEESVELMRVLVAQSGEGAGLGAEDPALLVEDREFLGVSLARLGVNRLDLGRVEEGQLLFEEALALGLDPEGSAADAVLHAMRGLARVLVQTGDPVGGEEMARDVLELAHRNPVVPPEFKRTVRQILAVALKNQGRYEEAMAELDLLLAELEEQGLGRSLEKATLLTTVADLALRSNDLERGEEAYREGLSIRQENDESADPPLWLFQAGLARVLLRRGDHDRAGVAFEAAIATKRSLGMDRHPYMATTLVLLAEVRIAQERPGEAMDLLLEALVITEDVLARNHPNRQQILKHVGAAMALGLEDPEFAAPLERFYTTMAERGNVEEFEALEAQAQASLGG